VKPFQTKFDEVLGKYWKNDRFSTSWIPPANHHCAGRNPNNAFREKNTPEGKKP